MIRRSAVIRDVGRPALFWGARIDLCLSSVPSGHALVASTLQFACARDKSGYRKTASQVAGEKPLVFREGAWLVRCSSANSPPKDRLRNGNVLPPLVLRWAENLSFCSVVCATSRRMRVWRRFFDHLFFLARRSSVLAASVRSEQRPTGAATKNGHSRLCGCILNSSVF